MEIEKPVYLVEATTYEKDALERDWRGRIASWQNLAVGRWWQIGTIAKLPICVSISFARLNGKLVGFYQTISRAVDHTKVERWLNTHVCHRREDALNFQNCLSELGIDVKGGPSCHPPK